MKFKRSDVDKMIKEEFQKMMEKKKLSSRLSQINEELSKIDSEDSILNEVEASGMQKTQSDTGLVPGEQHGVKFEKIGTHLKEDETSEEDMEISVDSDSSSEMEASSEAEPEMEIQMGEFEAKFAEIGKAIDAKLAAESTSDDLGTEEPAEMSSDSENTDDDFTEVEVEEGGSDEEIEEYKEVVGGVGAEQGMTADDAIKKESVDEPIEGHSVAQEAPADDVNDNMDKDTHVKEGQEKSEGVINEAKVPSGKNIFTEGIDEKKKTKLLEELNRMKKFAGLSRDEE